MHKREQSLQKHLNDALIDISDDNSAHSLELLASNGVNTTALMKNSLEKIKGYSTQLSAKVKDDEKRIQLAELKNKLNELLMINPEKANRFIHSFIKNKPSFVRYQSLTRLEDSFFEETENLSSLNDLIKKLESELDSNK